MIGVFDSGYGGLAVLKDVLKELPQYDYFYLGDNARAPYGNRSTETLIKFASEAVDYLFAKGCALIIIACNSASSNVLRYLQEEYLRKPNVTDRKILGVIKPMVEEAVKISKKKTVGVVGTRSTIQSKTYETEINHLNPHIRVCSQACPLLVPFIEEGWHGKPEAKMVLKKYLRPLKSCNIDTLILGCTHYPVLHKDFVKFMGKNVRVMEPGKVIAKSLRDYLRRHPEIETRLTKNGKRVYATTDTPEKFQKLGSEFIGFPLKKVEKIEL